MVAEVTGDMRNKRRTKDKEIRKKERKVKASEDTLRKKRGKEAQMEGEKKRKQTAVKT